MKTRLMFVIGLLSTAGITLAQKKFEWKTATAGGYSYRYVTNDPTKSRFYTLKNGLSVILSKNNKEPNITFKMAVRAGSNTDPKTNTGLAHYLEHLLFKGTDKFGTKDYAKEKPLLDQITALYEVYNKTTDPVKRKEIYAQIDKISGQASNYSIANEYDKMMKSIGSKTTNAHTAVEETVYEEDLPSNAVDKFLAIQAERFRAPVFRLFHTELEAVYEEKNRGLDNDGWKIYENLLKALFPTHNYGLQTTIGTVEHLKNPSLVEIRKYYNKYYVPNNMAVIMSGDINYEELIKKIDVSFAYMLPKPLELYHPAPEKPLTKIQTVEVYGPSAEEVNIAYRGFAQNSHESLLLDLISSILSNGKAGLMDININKLQKMLRAGAEYQQMKDYGFFVLSGSPKSGQSLDDAKKLLLDQLEMLKKGSFDESLIKATVANIKLQELQSYENNGVRANAAMVGFIQNRGKEWDRSLSSTDAMAKITKNEIIAFANRFFVNNYVLAYKRKGVDKDIEKIEKPVITAVKTNTNEVSNFTKNIIQESVKPITAKFLDYKKDIAVGKLGIAEIVTVQNTDNEIFRLSYRLDLGAYHNKLLPYAAQYLTYLGTDKYTAEEISRAFYNLACNYNVNVGTDASSISISGLQENFKEALSLLEHLIANCKPNEKALEEFKGRILKSRDNSKLNKSSILSGLTNYAQYGADNPFNYGLSDQEIKNLKSSDLISILHNLTNYQHTIAYFGPKTHQDISTLVSANHLMPKVFIAVPPIKTFSYANNSATKVYFADYDMVQAEIQWVRNSGPYDAKDAAKVALFNDYFGGGMGSIVFQTIRESKALAYSTYALYNTPKQTDKQNTIIAYVGAQADKMNEAISGMNELLTTLPESEKSFAISKANRVTMMETSRVSNSNILSRYFEDKRLGFDHDSRIDEYAALKPLTFKDVQNFHELNFSGKPFVYCIVASEKRISDNDLNKIGPVTKLSLKEIFGY